MKDKRIHWVDQWRGLAVILMIVYHFAYDLNYLNLYSVNLGDLFWFLEANFVRLSFLFIVGISLYLSRKNYSVFSAFFKRHAMRAGILFLVAMTITLVTWFIDRSNTVYFGILHLITFGILLGALLVQKPFFAAFLGLLGFYFGAVFVEVTLEIPYLLPFGIIYPGFTSLDYFPLFPWISFVLFGIGLAHFLNWIGALNPSSKWPQLKSLEWLGKHALLVYLVHQPILIGGLWIYINI